MKRAAGARRSELRVGCAGWALPSKAAALFPPTGSHLERFAQVLSCVEINSSFYRSHQEKTYLRWGRSVPDTFRFSVKVPRTITHELGLRRCGGLLEAFVREVSALGDTLGCILVQLPPSLALDVRSANAFFSLLRSLTSAPVACEPRHASWFTPRGAATLGKAGVAHVWADPSPVDGAEPHDENGMLYIRLHGSPRMYYSAYDDAFIEAIATKLRSARDEGRDAWCVFDNTAAGEAVPNALSLMERIAPRRRT